MARGAWTADACQTTYWEKEARRFAEAGFWEDKPILQSGAKSGLTILRLLVDQAAQAVYAKQRENEEADQELAEALWSSAESRGSN